MRWVKNSHFILINKFNLTKKEDCSLQNLNSYSYPTHESILSTDLSVYEASEIYTYKVQNEHDIIFKDLFSDKDETTKFINKFLNLDQTLIKYLST